jgi:hypothetical protein
MLAPLVAKGAQPRAGAEYKLDFNFQSTWTDAGQRFDLEHDSVGSRRLAEQSIPQPRGESASTHGTTHYTAATLDWTEKLAQGPHGDQGCRMRY